MQSSLHLRDDRDQLSATITCFPSFGEDNSSGEPDRLVSVLESFYCRPSFGAWRPSVAVMQDYHLTANRSKACAPMLADPSNPFQILATSCFRLSRSPQLALYSFAHVPHQIPGSPRELFTKTDTCDGFYSAYLQELQRSDGLQH